MPELKIPENERFFAFVVWVALIGAALILAIDYTMKRQLLALAKEVRGELNGQASTGRIEGTGYSHIPVRSPDMGNVPMADPARMETADVPEHDPFPVRQVARTRDERGRFAAQNSDGIPREGNSTIPGTNHPVES